MTKQRYGWIPDLPDRRDHRFVPERLGLLEAGLVPHIDLRHQLPARV